jgi:hypothetical protein
LVVIVNEPFEGVPEVGAYSTLKLAVAPAATVVEVVMPLTLNPVPVTLICEMVSGVLPLFFRLAGNVSVLPTVTLPKPAVAGLAAGCACSPVPVKPMVEAVLEALLMIETLPVPLPSVVGV